jgi:hypothetical protein
MVKRTRSMELRAMRQGLVESPPPPPPNATVREWFAGLALANPELMKGIPQSLRPMEALRLADELILAMQAPKVPSLESMAAPSEEEMVAWDKQVASENQVKDMRSRPTNPEGLRIATKKSPITIRSKTIAFGAVLPSPATHAPPSPIIRHEGLPAPTRYSSLQQAKNEDDE